MTFVRYSTWIAGAIALYALIALGVRFYAHNSERMLLQRILASRAENLRSGAFKSAITTQEGAKRRDKAIELLSNDVFDEKVILVGAQVRPPSKNEYVHPLFRNSPSLCWWVVDELGRIA